MKQHWGSIVAICWLIGSLGCTADVVGSETMDEKELLRVEASDLDGEWNEAGTFGVGEGQSLVDEYSLEA